MSDRSPSEKVDKLRLKLRFNPVATKLMTWNASKHCNFGAEGEAGDLVHWYSSSRDEAPFFFSCCPIVGSIS